MRNTSASERVVVRFLSEYLCLSKSSVIVLVGLCEPEIYLLSKHRAFLSIPAQEGRCFLTHRHRDCCRSGFICFNSSPSKVEFLLKTDSGYPRDAEVTLFTLANPEHSLRFITHWSAPPVSALARSGGLRKMSQSPVSRNSNIDRRMDRPRVVVGAIRGVA